MKSVGDVIPDLIAATSSGKLRWKRESYADIFEAELGKYTFNVWQWTNESDDTAGYTLTMEYGGKVVDSMQGSEFSPRYSALEELFSSARRSHFNVDSLIEDFQAELKKL